MMMYQGHIKLTANDMEAEPDRIKRLERVVGYICALSDKSGNVGLLDKIAKLHDHKGTLTVTWNSKPTAEEKALVSKAWGSRIGDGVADNVEHEGA